MVLLTSVLVVDDDKEMRMMLCEVLKEEGYMVEAVSNGKEAIKICQKTPFDLALVDIELPDIKGTELLTKLVAIQPKMVKIIITGHPSIENAMKAVNEKADGYILKPLDISNMLQKMQKLLEERTKNYLTMFAEIEEERKRTPLLKYNSPDRW